MKQNRRGFLGSVAAVVAVPSVAKGPLPQPKTVAEQVAVRPYSSFSCWSPDAMTSVATAWGPGYVYGAHEKCGHRTMGEVTDHARLMAEADRKRASRG